MPFQIRNIIDKPLIKVFLVDDDQDDYLFFKKALQFQVFKTTLQKITCGEDLMDELNDENLVLPDVIFLDINMPEKDGYACLVDIKDSARLKNIPTVMYSTSYQKDVADMLFEIGADFFIKKPKDFNDVRKAIEKALCFVTENEQYSPTRDNFLIAS